MKKVSADQGLFVSWDGFNAKMPAEEREQFFTIRLWDSGKLIKAILDNYEAILPEIQAGLPLKRIWVLVQDAAEWFEECEPDPIELTASSDPAELDIEF